MSLAVQSAIDATKPLHNASPAIDTDAPSYEQAPLMVLGRENRPGMAEVAPGQAAWARKYAWDGRNRARSACSGAKIRPG
jgi:hypothetical protein